jgi:hypothetical protein
LTRIFDNEAKRTPAPLAPARQLARLGNRDFGREAAHKAEAPWQGHDDPSTLDRPKDRHSHAILKQLGITQEDLES